ncbi:MAG: hypothetical protein OSJ83_04125 [Clostridia bacterium]|nr:hypothetical protein [Clostridia bacterium]
MKCYDCPRACGVDRDVKLGVCHGGRYARIAEVIDDFEYEEPCLGTVTAVFFGGCSLGCSYCQNRKISRGVAGEEYDDAALAGVLSGAKNPLDLVTPSHYLGAIERAYGICGKTERVIYNTSGYETIDAVRRASEFTDVFLTDYKYADRETGAAFSRAPDYCDTAIRAVAEMRRRVRDEWREENGKKLLVRGLIVRHLVLPGRVKNSLAAIDRLADTVGTDTVLSLMSQFTPNGIGEPRVPLNKIEYKIVVEHAIKRGFETGYIQDFSSASAKYTPKFN